MPGYDYGLRVTPTTAGDFRIICNEFCGIGHHTMVGRVIVVDSTGTVAVGNREASDERDRFPDLPRHRPTIHRHAETLVKANAVVAVVSLLIGAIAAVLLVLTRWQAVHLLPAEWFYRILGVHGMSMLIFFIIFFEMAVLIFASTVADQRPDRRRPGWAGRRSRSCSAAPLLVEVIMWAGKADVLFTSYRAPEGAPALLPGHHPVRGRRAPRLRASSSPTWWSPSGSRPTPGRCRSWSTAPSPRRSSPSSRCSTARPSTSRRSSGRSALCTWTPRSTG